MKINRQELPNNKQKQNKNQSKHLYSDVCVVTHPRNLITSLVSFLRRSGNKRLLSIHHTHLPEHLRASLHGGKNKRRRLATATAAAAAARNVSSSSHYNLSALGVMTFWRFKVSACAFLLSLYHKCNSTTIRLRHDYDEKLTCSFLLASNRVDWKQARAIRRSRIVSYRSRIAIVIRALVRPRITCARY